jgi:hypothetical protein
MMTKISEAEFDMLVRRAGLTLTARQRGEIYRAYGTIESLTERLRQPRAVENEPATIVTLDKDHRP